MKTRMLVAVCCLAFASVVRADDWTQYRGPDRLGVSSEKGLLKKWPAGGPTLTWTYKNAGLGFSSMAIAKGTVYTLGTDMKFEDEYLIAINEKDGSVKIKNAGEIMVVDFKNNGAKLPNAPAPAAPPGIPLPGAAANIGVPGHNRFGGGNPPRPVRAEEPPPLTPETQIVLMELERERTKAQVAAGELPPLPPTEITPTDESGGRPPAPK